MTDLRPVFGWPGNEYQYAAYDPDTGRCHYTLTGSSRKPSRQLVRDWRDELREGSVVKSDRGTYRIIREALYGHPGGFLRSVALVIMHCSQYHAAYTIKGRTELLHWERVPVRVQLRSDFDAKFRDDLLNGTRELDCCIVRGIP